MGLKEIIAKLRARSQQRKEVKLNLENQYHAQESIETKRLSANERELNKYLEENRQKAIKRQLDYHRKVREHEMTYGHNPVYIKNIVHDDKNLFRHKKLFSNPNTIIKNKQNNKLFFK